MGYLRQKIEWFLGIDNRSRPDGITPPHPESGGARLGTLRECPNMDVTHNGDIVMRNGYAQGHAATAAHDLSEYRGTLYYQDGTALYKSDGTTATAITTGLSASTRLGVAGFAEDVYFHNGTDAYFYDGTNCYPWEVERPAAAPVLAASGSGTDLLEGRYTYCLTYLRGYKESPPSDIASITISAGQQIDLSSIPVPSDASIDGKRLYRTSANGTIDDGIRWVQDIPVGTTSATDTLADHKRQVGCHTFGMRGPFQSAIVAVFRNRILQANGKFVQWSEPNTGWLFQERMNSYHGDKVKMIAVDRGGVYVSTAEKTDYLNVTDLDMPTSVQMPGSSEYGALRCDPVYVQGVPYWLSRYGFVRGVNGNVERVSGELFELDTTAEAWLGYNPTTRRIIANVAGVGVYVLHLDTSGAVTEYTNYGFTGFGWVNGTLYGMKPDGVYDCSTTATTDNGTAISCYYKTGDMGSEIPGFLRLRQVDLDLECDGDIVVSAFDSAGTEYACSVGNPYTPKTTEYSKEHVFMTATLNSPVVAVKVGNSSGSNLKVTGMGLKLLARGV